LWNSGFEPIPTKNGYHKQEEILRFTKNSGFEPIPWKNGYHNSNYIDPDLFFSTMTLNIGFRLEPDVVVRWW
jgi:hypothetical protein